MATKYVIYCTQAVPSDVNPDTGEALAYGNLIPGVTSYTVDGPNNGFAFERDTTGSGFISRDQVQMILPYEETP